MHDLILILFGFLIAVILSANGIITYEKRVKHYLSREWRCPECNSMVYVDKRGPGNWRCAKNHVLYRLEKRYE